MGSLNIAAEHSAHPEQRKIHRLEDEIQRLKDQITILQDAISGLSQHPAEWEMEWGLTPQQAAFFGALVQHPVGHKAALMSALFWDRHPDEEPDQKILDVIACKVRRKVRRQGIEIRTLFGRGWYLDEEIRVRFGGKPFRRSGSAA